MSTTDENHQHCAAFRKDGRPCESKPTKSGYCVAHDPRAAEWRVLGGQAKSTAERSAKLLPGRFTPIVDGLERVFFALEQGTVDPKIALAMAGVATALCRVFMVGEHEQRMRDLEAAAASWHRQQKPTAG